MPTTAAKTSRNSVKSRAMRTLKSLPQQASWDDVMYQLYVRQKIEAGLGDLNAGRTHSHESLRKEFSLKA